jgi:hypothetical protein
MLGQRPRGELLRLAERRADRYPAMANPGPGPPRHRRIHRLVQRHPAAQHPGYLSPAEYEASTRKKELIQVA